VLRWAERFAYEWASIKRTILSFPLLQALQGFVDPAKASSGISTIEYRPEETIYICPDEGKVTVVFSLSYADPNDMEIAKVFLEEFRAAKRDRDIGTAPNVNYTPAPPGELSEVTVAPSDARVGFLSFTFEKRHVSSEEKLTHAIDMLFSLRSYLHYHIKCCKGYMHTRMRYRVAELLKILNRADPAKVFAPPPHIAVGPPGGEAVWSLHGSS
jgi:actin related protein 2/3 complex subunit 2